MDLQDVRLLFVTKNFSAFRGISHIGLGVSAMLCAKVLSKEGIRTEVEGIVKEQEVRDLLLNDHDPVRYTHVVVSAPWISAGEYMYLTRRFPTVHFAMNCHSNVGFLQADAQGCRNFRDDLGVEKQTYNFHVGGNSRKFCIWVEEAYNAPCVYLPNLYYLDHLTNPARPGWPQTRGVLRIGIFGAARAQKNFISAIGAALQLAFEQKAQAEILVSTNREDDQASRTLMNAARALTDNLPHVRLVPVPWATWPNFRPVVGSCHILLQPSYTESFNLVTCDGIAEGVATVASEAIDWVPSDWHASIDDVDSITRRATALLYDQRAAKNGLDALVVHNTDGVLAWKKYLTGTKP